MKITKKTLIKKPVKKKKSPAKKKLNADVFEKELEAACVALSNVSTDIVADDPMFIPKYATEDSVCADLVANLKDAAGQRAMIQHRGVVVIDCGFSMAVPKGYKAEIVARSGFASKGLIVCNAPGQIDSDYRGRVKVIVCNVGQCNPITINHGERFAQISITMVNKFDWKAATVLPPTARGEGGFGSTGV